MWRHGSRGGNMEKAYPKFGAWRASVRDTRLKEVKVDIWQKVQKKKELKKGKKAPLLQKSLFLLRWWHFDSYLGAFPGRGSRGSTFGPQILVEPDSVSNVARVYYRSISSLLGVLPSWEKQLFWGITTDGYYGITGVIPCLGSQIAIHMHALHYSYYYKNTPNCKACRRPKPAQFAWNWKHRLSWNWKHRLETENIGYPYTLQPAGSYGCPWTKTTANQRSFLTSWCL